MQNIKTPLFIILFIFLGLFVYTKLFGPIPFSVNSVTTTKSDTFSVTGEGKATAIPDTASVDLGITITQNTVASAQSQANQIINKISSDLKNLGVKEKDIKTTNYSISPNYDFTSGKQSVNGYNVSVNLSVKVNPIEKINQVIDTATKDGANSVGNIQFTLNDEEKTKLENQARKQAVDAAKQKAQSLAQASGIRLGRIINVSESNQEQRPITFMEKSAVGLGASDTSVEPGQSTISTTVTLSYETL